MPSNKFGFEMRELVLNPFKMHLSDAIMAAHLAKHAESRPEIKAMHSRTAVAHAVFALECAANCFLTLVPRNHHFRDKAELWTALDKFDLYLLSLPGNPKLPRGEPKLKAVQELFKIRDRHVHPRSMHLEVSEPSNPAAAFKVKWPDTVPIPMAPASFIWSHTDASTAINIVLDFLRFFLGVAGLTSSQVITNLSTLMVCEDGKRRADVGNFDKALKLASSIDVDVCFLLPTNG